MNVIKIRNGERETKNKNWDRKYSGNPHNSLKWRTTTRKKGLNRRLSFPAPHFRFLVQRSPLSVPHSPYSVLLSALPVPVFSNIHTKTKLLNAWQSSHWSTAGNQARITLHRWNRPDFEPVWGEIKYSYDNLLCTSHESGIFFMILSLSGSKRKEMFTLLFCKGYEADNVILLTLCPQPVRGSVCLYGWVYFCSHCKCVLRSDAYLNAFQIIIQRRKTANTQSVEWYFFLQEQHITICRTMLLEIAQTDDYYKMLQPLMITKCVTRFCHKFLQCVLQNAFILAKCRNCYYKMLVSPSITFVVALKSSKLMWAVKITF